MVKPKSVVISKEAISGTLICCHLSQNSAVIPISVFVGIKQFVKRFDVFLYGIMQALIIISPQIKVYKIIY